MKRSSTPYGPRSRRLRSTSLSRLASVGCASLLLASPLACVSTARYDELAAERNQLAVARRNLEEKVRLQGIATESLEDQVASLMEEREDLTEQRDALERDLAARTASEAELARRLRAREAELSVTASALIEESRKVGELTTTYDALVGDLEAELAAGEIHIEQLRDGLQVDVAQDILFPSGAASLSKSGMAVLKTVAARLAELPYQISVEGHSDSRKIGGALKQRYPTNWELAGARAASVVRLFVASGIDGAKLAAVSHGSYRPIADEATAAGRARNRRIEILLRPDPDAAPRP